jgi:hypothetical protein
MVFESSGILVETMADIGYWASADRYPMAAGSCIPEG